jgi:2-C-methyl-D-erythritol 2,4-cyclodiphosphate synthase
LSAQIKIGFGYDVHKFAENRKLIIGGVEVPFEKGLLGHSDADVLLHAICDAILGALALGDIGKHFPDTDPKYKDIDSKQLLSHVFYLMRDNRYEVGNIDSTILLQNPKIASHIPKMCETIANILCVHAKQISIKATTTEGLGFVGREEGCAAYAVVLLNRKEK